MRMFRFHSSRTNKCYMASPLTSVSQSHTTGPYAAKDSSTNTQLDPRTPWLDAASSIRAIISMNKQFIQTTSSIVAKIDEELETHNCNPEKQHQLKCQRMNVLRYWATLIDQHNRMLDMHEDLCKHLKNYWLRQSPPNQNEEKERRGGHSMQDTVSFDGMVTASRNAIPLFAPTVTTTGLRNTPTAAPFFSRNTTNP